MTDVMQDLLIDFDEMGFAPTTACPNPDKYACEWKEKLVSEISCLQEQLEAAIAGQETLQKALADKDRIIKRLTDEKDQLIKTFGECQAEATRALAEKDKEIKRLKNNISAMAVTMRNCAKATRAEAIRAFAERLKAEQSFYDGQETRVYLTEKDLDNLVKEMVGDAE